MKAETVLLTTLFVGIAISGCYGFHEEGDQCSVGGEIYPQANCSLYVICECNNYCRLVLQSCPLNTYYNPREQICTFPREVPECQNGLRPPDDVTTTTTTEKVTTTTTETPPAIPSCANSGVYTISAVENCSAYFICAGSVPHEMSCPPDTFFDQKYGACNIADRVVECSPDYCPEDVIEYRPILGRCNEYTICAFGIKYTGSCPEDTLFDPVHLKCNTYSNVKCE